MNRLLKNKIVKLVALLMITSVRAAFSQEIESDFDYLRSPKTTIKGLHRFFVGMPFGKNLSFGQAFKATLPLYFPSRLLVCWGDPES